METKDFNLLGNTFVIVIKGWSDSYLPTTEVKPFALAMTLKTTGPEFVQPPTAPELYCGPSARNWQMTIPEVNLNEQLDATVKLDPGYS